MGRHVLGYVGCLCPIDRTPGLIAILIASVPDLCIRFTSIWIKCTYVLSIVLFFSYIFTFLNVKQ